MASENNDNTPIIATIIVGIILTMGILRNENVTNGAFAKLFYCLISLIPEYIGAVIGNGLRKLAMPSMYFASGFFDAIMKRLFWEMGPQLIGAAIAGWLTLTYLMPSLNK